MKEMGYMKKQRGAKMIDLQKIIIEEIDNFYRRNLFNKYFNDDFKEFIKELEEKYNCEINR